MRCSSPHWRCDLMMKLPPQVNTAFEMLEAAGYEAYLVGGAVRDYVRDNSPAKDWDITTNALPEQVEEIFTGYHLIETVLSPNRCRKTARWRAAACQEISMEFLRTAPAGAGQAVTCSTSGMGLRLK